MSLIHGVQTNPKFLEDNFPLPRQEEKKKEDWVSITAIVLLIISGLIAVFSGFCFARIFPSAIFGGPRGTFLVLLTSGIIAISSGVIAYYKR